MGLGGGVRTRRGSERRPYLTWFYTRSSIRGAGTLDARAEGPWPLPPGRYSVYLLADDAYDILARTGFVIR